MDYTGLQAAVLYTIQWDKGGKKSRLSEDKFGDGDMLSIYKDTHGLTLDGFVGKFVSVTFGGDEEPFTGFVERRSDVRKVGEGEKHWDIQFDGESKSQAISLEDGEWVWEFL